MEASRPCCVATALLSLPAALHHPRCTHIPTPFAPQGPNVVGGYPHPNDPTKIVSQADHKAMVAGSDAVEANVAPKAAAHAHHH